MKSGLHWGDNTMRPYPVSDTTASGEAARMVIERMLGRDKRGGKSLLNCTTGSAYRPCALILDGDALSMVLVNDGVLGAASGAGKPQGLAVSVSLKTLVGADLQSGSIGAPRSPHAHSARVPTHALRLCAAAAQPWCRSCRPTAFTARCPGWSRCRRPTTCSTGRCLRGA